MAEMHKITDTIFFDPNTGTFINKPADDNSGLDVEKDPSVIESEKTINSDSQKVNNRNSKPVIVFFQSDKSLLTDEAPAIISWSVERANIVKINKKKVAMQGTMPFHSKKPREMRLTAKNNEGQTVSKSIFIDIDKTSPRIEFFKSERDVSVENYPVRLSWKVIGAVSLNINNGIGDVSGLSEIVVNPQTETDYLLTAKNFFGVESLKKLRIQIIPSPVIGKIFIPAPIFNFKEISTNRLLASTPQHVPDILIKQPSFTDTVSMTDLEKFSNRILFNKDLINTVLFPNNIFQTLINKQKELTKIIHSIWKKKVKTNIRKMVGVQ